MTKIIEFIPTELQEHLAFIDWCNLFPTIKSVIIHIPNEGIRTPKEGNKLKKMGLRKGVSDFFIPIPNGKYHGLWIELKRKKGSKVSIEQQEFINKMVINGYEAKIAHGCKHAIDIVLDYFSFTSTVN